MSLPRELRGPSGRISFLESKELYVDLGSTQVKILSITLFIVSFFYCCLLCCLIFSGRRFELCLVSLNCHRTTLATVHYKVSLILFTATFPSVLSLYLISTSHSLFNTFSLARSLWHFRVLIAERGDA
ncbi:hypothetical protein GGS21DRAFT_535853 [Xylaria nigripes]|nr:hypothetical protein GGS21DRAFT_535853 [Xylaria nigripes]